MKIPRSSNYNYRIPIGSLLYLLLLIILWLLKSTGKYRHDRAVCSCLKQVGQSSWTKPVYLPTYSFACFIVEDTNMLQAVHTYVHISLLPAWLLDVSNENALKLYMYSKRVSRILSLEYEPPLKIWFHPWFTPSTPGLPLNKKFQNTSPLDLTRLNKNPAPPMCQHFCNYNESLSRSSLWARQYFSFRTCILLLSFF